MIGTYLFRLPSNEHVKPYAIFGGGMVRFSPNSDYTTGITPRRIRSQPSPTDLEPTFRSIHTGPYACSIVACFAAILDFKLSSEPFGTGLKTHVPEPSIQLVYHF